MRRAAADAAGAATSAGDKEEMEERRRCRQMRQKRTLRLLELGSNWLVGWVQILSFFHLDILDLVISIGAAFQKKKSNSIGASLSFLNFLSKNTMFFNLKRYWKNFFFNISL